MNDIRVDRPIVLDLNPSRRITVRNCYQALQQLTIIYNAEVGYDDPLDTNNDRCFAYHTALVPDKDMRQWCALMRQWSVINPDTKERVWVMYFDMPTNVTFQTCADLWNQYVKRATESIPSVRMEEMCKVFLEETDFMESYKGE
ncbi:hypothetical protein HOU08_gp053 [Dickeya phage vB_DsoM_JA29]|uniref:Uncharacterized protein n=1 Tax=Dickeya phage vB_DsoM_JA29 TaxID=2283031 RepID=A0A384ZX26_9CAUD|nr:hypothetical protein HOU08_gp053 [Dickeya phage vB_DsoM_JA29]AXG66779.1 hypothetical protein JA29_053 [Dickeya phage vB_DsoM_JA29]